MVDCFLLSCSSASMTRLTTISSGPYSSLRTSLAAFFCSPNLRGTLLLFLFCFFSKWKVCFFAHQNAKPLPFEALRSKTFLSLGRVNVSLKSKKEDERSSNFTNNILKRKFTVYLMSFL